MIKEKKPCLKMIIHFLSKVMNRYRDNIKIMKGNSKLIYRMQMVQYAMKHSISEAAKVYNTTRKTVRKWVKRYKEGGKDSLKNKSRIGQYYPNKMPKKIEDKIIETRRKYPFWGSRRIKEYLMIEYSHVTINKKLKQAGLIKKKEKLYKRTKESKQFFIKMRESYMPFQKIQIDIKYLTDIPEIKKDIMNYNLPKYQITARDYKTGFQHISFCYEKSSTSTGIYIDYLCQQLENAGIDVSKITFQTDNGSEFVNNFNKNKLSLFEEIITKKYKAKLKRIPPASPRHNSDVETVHNLIEDEFYKVENFNSKEDMLIKTYAYLIYFNNFRKNRNRNNKTPREIFKEDMKKYWCNTINFKPIIVDYFIKNISYIKQHGYFSYLPPKNFKIFS